MHFLDAGYSGNVAVSPDSKGWLNILTMNSEIETIIDTGQMDPLISERQSAGWDMQNASRNYLWLVISYGASAAFALASVLLLTRSLGTENYGGIIAVIAASQVVQIFLNWSTVAMIRFGIEEFVKNGNIRNSFWSRMYILIPNIILAFALATLWFPPLSQWLKLPSYAFLLVAVNLFSGALWQHFQYGLQGIKLAWLQGTLAAIEKLLIFAAVLTLVATTRLDIFTAVLAYSFAPLITCFVAIIYLRRSISLPPAPDMTHIKKMLVYSLPLFPFSVIGYFSSNYLDSIFIINLLDLRKLAIYSIAVQINSVILQLPLLANSLLLPMFVTMHTREAELGGKTETYFTNVVPLLTLIWGGGCVVISLAGYYLIPLILGSDFLETGTALWILLAASNFHAVIYFGYAALANAHMLSSVSLYSALCSASINLSLNFVLIPRFGLRGCALATAAAFLVSLVTFVFFLKRKVSFKVSWTPAALVPIVAALAVIILFSAPLAAIAVWLTACGGVIILFYPSVRIGLKMLIDRGRSPLTTS